MFWCIFITADMSFLLINFLHSFVYGSLSLGLHLAVGSHLMTYLHEKNVNEACVHAVFNASQTTAHACCRCNPLSAPNFRDHL